MKKTTLLFLAVCMVIIPAGCSPNKDNAAQSEPTAIEQLSTPTLVDPCNDATKDAELQQTMKYGRRFDDSFTLAQAAPRDGLPVVILEMQSARREYEDVTVVCHHVLKTDQLKYMSSAISAMTSFMAGADEDTIKTQFTSLRDARNQYEKSLAEAKGVEYTPPTAVPTQAATITAQPLPTGTPSPVTAVAAQDTYVLLGPSPGYPAIGVLEAGQTVNVTGMLENGLWLEVVMPDTPDAPGWVYVEMMSVIGDASALPILEPPTILQQTPAE